MNQSVTAFTKSTMAWLWATPRDDRFTDEQLAMPGLLVIQGHRSESPCMTFDEETTESLLTRWMVLRSNRKKWSASELLSITFALHLHCL